MFSKQFIYVLIFIFSGIGSYVPTLWGAGYLSASSLMGSTLGGLLGIYIGFEIRKRYL